MESALKDSFEYDELIACAQGKLFGPGNAQLPAPPMLMFDKIVKISKTGGEYGQGMVEAELCITPTLWFFQCHFISDPVMPGCLGLDALWQLAGFYISWLEYPGRGRALGCGEVKFSGQVTPEKQKIRYVLDIKRIIDRKTKLIIADGTVYCDSDPIYKAKKLTVGLFENI